MTNNLLMQTKLGRTHDTIKEFGSKGSPLREAFWHKVKTDRVKKHIDFLFEEQHAGKFKDPIKEVILKDQYKKAIKKLQTRGYQII